jgi:membrane protein
MTNHLGDRQPDAAEAGYATGAEAGDRRPSDRQSTAQADSRAEPTQIGAARHAAAEGAATDADQARPGRRPQGPAHTREGSLMQTMKRTWSEFSEDNLTDSAAALTYYAVLSIFPALLALGRSWGLSAIRTRSLRR